MKLTPRLTLIFVVYAAILLAVVALLAYNSGKDSLHSAVLSGLLSTANEKQAALNEWVEEKRQDIAVLAADPVVVSYAAVLTAFPPDSPEAQAAHRQWLSEVHPRVEGGKFTDLMLIEPQMGRVVAATDAGEEGAYKQDRPFFTHGKIAPFVQDLYPSIALGEPAMTAAAPLRTPEGRLLGVLAGRLDLAEMNAILGRRTGLHESDDSFLVNSSAQFVTPPRFVETPELLTQTVDTEVVNLCLLGASGHVDAVDYRGVPAVAVYRWIPERELCLIVKMDQDEAYAPVRALGARLATISAAALLAAAALAVILSRTLAWPIIALQAAAARFSRGELGLRLPETSRDELGSLARAFNAMASALERQELHLRQRAANLGAEVEERTSALRATEDRLRTTMDSMLEGAQIIGFDNRYLYVNDAAAAQGKKPKVDLLGRTMMECYPGIDRSGFFPVLRRCMDLREPAQLENEFAFPDGSKGWFNLSLQPAPEGVFILSQDITERKRAEETLRRHAEQVEALNRVARIVSGSLKLDEIYDGFSSELRRLFRVDRSSITQIDEAGGRWTIARQWTAGDTELGPGTWRPLEGSFVEAVMRSGRPIIESPIDPEGRWEESPLLRAEGIQSRIVIPLKVKDRVFGTLSIASQALGAFSETDLEMAMPMAGPLALAVENIRLYEAERDHAADLELRVAERTAELEAANKELEAFSYSVSHDLRAPLRAVDGFSRILVEDHARALDGDARRYLDLVRGGTQQMGRLIDDLLEFSRLGRKELARRAVNPTAVAHQALDQLEADRAGRAVEVQVDDMPEVDADPNLLRQVYVNLLANALKFTRARNPARIRVGAKSVDGDMVFYVQDNGVGFDMSYAGKLFGVFQRLHRAEDYEGTGVGLAIVQRIVHRHGGRIWAEGGLDRGAEFNFTLPRRREE